MSFQKLVSNLHSSFAHIIVDVGASAGHYCDNKSVNECVKLVL